MIFIYTVIRDSGSTFALLVVSWYLQSHTQCEQSNRLCRDAVSFHIMYRNIKGHVEWL